MGYDYDSYRAIDEALEEGRQQIRRIFNSWRKDPKTLVPAFKDQIPGITDEDALKLAISFTGIYDDPGKMDKNYLKYRRFRGQIERKYAAQAGNDPRH